MSLLFKRAKKVLLPNGKLYVYHEDPQVIEAFEKQAKAAGFSTRKRDENISTIVAKTSRGKSPRNVIARDKTITMWVGDCVDKPLYRLECTYRLKTALPSRRARIDYSGEGH